MGLAAAAARCVAPLRGGVELLGLGAGLGQGAAVGAVGRPRVGLGLKTLRAGVGLRRSLARIGGGGGPVGVVEQAPHWNAGRIRPRSGPWIYRNLLR